MARISTGFLTLLPDAIGLKRLLQSMAMLDAILCPEWEFRYYSFNAHWSEGEALGSMRDGQGDDFFAAFSRAGSFLKGFVHDAPAAQRDVSRGVLIEEISPEFAEYLSEPAFKIDETTFCIWRRHSDSAWQASSAWLSSGDDGSEQLLSPLDGSPETYKVWAEDYYEREVDVGAVASVYAHERLTDGLVRSLSPDLDLRELAADIREIGYPAA